MNKGISPKLVQVGGQFYLDYTDMEIEFRLYTFDSFLVAKVTVTYLNQPSRLPKVFLFARSPKYKKFFECTNNDEFAMIPRGIRYAVLHTIDLRQEFCSFSYSGFKKFFAIAIADVLEISRLRCRHCGAWCRIQTIYGLPRTEERPNFLYEYPGLYPKKWYRYKVCFCNCCDEPTNTIHKVSIPDYVEGMP